MDRMMTVDETSRQLVNDDVEIERIDGDHQLKLDDGRPKRPHENITQASSSTTFKSLSTDAGSFTRRRRVSPTSVMAVDGDGNGDATISEENGTTNIGSDGSVSCASTSGLSEERDTDNDQHRQPVSFDTSVSESNPSPSIPSCILPNLLNVDADIQSSLCLKWETDEATLCKYSKKIFTKKLYSYSS